MNKLGQCFLQKQKNTAFLPSTLYFPALLGCSSEASCKEVLIRAQIVRHRFRDIKN